MMSRCLLEVRQQRKALLAERGFKETNADGILLWPDGTQKGQPVVLLIAPSPRDRSFRSQLGQLRRMYERYAAHRVVFIAAFTGEGGRIQSDIPFVLAADGPRVGYDYECIERFRIAFIGRDGNLDYVTNKVIPAQRAYDIVGNSFVPQRDLRRP